MLRAEFDSLIRAGWLTAPGNDATPRSSSHSPGQELSKYVTHEVFRRFSNAQLPLKLCTDIMRHRNSTEIWTLHA